MYNKLKSEQCFAVTSAKGVQVFQANLKVHSSPRDYDLQLQLETSMANISHWQQC